VPQERLGVGVFDLAVVAEDLGVEADDPTGRAVCVSQPQAVASLIKEAARRG
jgi:hypothetical protein